MSLKHFINPEHRADDTEHIELYSKHFSHAVNDTNQTGSVEIKTYNKKPVTVDVTDHQPATPLTDTRRF